MTAKQVLDTVELLDNAANHMLAWLRCRQNQRLDVRNGNGEWACDAWAYDYARIAGRYANELIDIAEKGRAA